MKKVIVALLVIVLLATLGLGGYAIWKLNNKIDEQNNKVLTMINEIKDDSSKNVINQNVANNNVVSNTTNNVATQTTTNTTANTTTNQGTSNVSLEEQIKTAYTKELAQSENILEYRIEGVDILSREEIKSEPGYGVYYTEDDTLAIVGYSIRIKDIHGDGVAGNGIIDGDWIKNKSACVVYKDGEIIQEGTSF